MLNQYHAQIGRFRCPARPHTLVGPVKAGDYLRIDGELVRVEGWHTRTLGAAARGPDGRWQSRQMAGGHLATVRRIRDGRALTVNEWELIRAHDPDLVAA